MTNLFIALLQIILGTYTTQEWFVEMGVRYFGEQHRKSLEGDWDLFIEYHFQQKPELVVWWYCYTQDDLGVMYDRLMEHTNVSERNCTMALAQQCGARLIVEHGRVVAKGSGIVPRGYDSYFAHFQHFISECVPLDLPKEFKHLNRRKLLEVSGLTILT